MSDKDALPGYGATLRILISDIDTDERSDWNILSIQDTLLAAFATK